MKSIIFIGHEASLTGAPFTQLYLIRWIKENTSYKVFLVLLNGGPLEQEFHKVADEVYIMWGDNQQNILPVRIAFKSSFLMSRRREVLLQRIKRIMEALKETLKNQIIEQLNLEDKKPSDIQDDDPLFGDGLGLDSIDALELIVLLEKHHRIKITNPEEGKKIFVSINSMADFITSEKK